MDLQKCVICHGHGTELVRDCDNPIIDCRCCGGSGRATSEQNLTNHIKKYGKLFKES